MLPPHRFRTAGDISLRSDPQRPVAKACAAIVLSDADGAAAALIEAMEQDYVKSVVMLLGLHRPLLQQAARWSELITMLGAPTETTRTEVAVKPGFTGA